ncbi:MAG: DNA-binding protein, partial [Parapedobacter sp.]
MAVEIITREDLMAFKAELLSELKTILSNTSTE